MHRLVRLGVLAAFLIAASGCTTWRVQHGGASDVFADERPRNVRIIDSGNNAYMLRQARLQRDTVFGAAGPDQRAAGVAVQDIRRISTRQVSALRTAALVVGVGAVGMLTLTAIAFGTALDNW